MMSSRALAICTIGKPCRSRLRRRAGRNSSGLVPTTKRICPRAQARGGTALTGLAGTPDSIARISNVHQANTFSASVSPGSARFGSMSGSPAPETLARSASARLTRSRVSFRQHGCLRGDIDGVLALVVDHTAPVVATIFLGHGPGREARMPARIKPADDIAVAVAKHGRQGRVLDPLGVEKRPLGARLGEC